MATVNQVSSLHRRKVKIRKKIAELGKVRLSVHRTLQHIYAQVISPEGRVIASASSVEKDVKSMQLDSQEKRKTAIAMQVGKLVAERAVVAGIKQVAFDRGGRNYHGRIKALATSARDNGLEF